MITGLATGCFDILHPDHVKLLTFARSQCDVLIVGINSDASIRRLKGPRMPFMTQTHRKILLEALKPVSAVTIFDEDTPKELILRLKPNVFVKGPDYRHVALPETEALDEVGATVIFAPHDIELHSSGFREALKFNVG